MQDTYKMDSSKLYIEKIDDQNKQWIMRNGIPNVPTANYLTH